MLGDAGVDILFYGHQWSFTWKGRLHEAVGEDHLAEAGAEMGSEFHSRLHVVLVESTAVALYQLYDELPHRQIQDSWFRVGW
jgi:hypothetical protein